LILLQVKFFDHLGYFEIIIWKNIIFQLYFLVISD
jgi:hypothetical protein